MFPPSGEKNNPYEDMPEQIAKSDMLFFYIWGGTTVWSPKSGDATDLRRRFSNYRLMEYKLYFFCKESRPATASAPMRANSATSRP